MTIRPVLAQAKVFLFERRASVRIWWSSLLCDVETAEASNSDGKIVGQGFILGPMPQHRAEELVAVAQAAMQPTPVVDRFPFKQDVNEFPSRSQAEQRKKSLQRREIRGAALTAAAVALADDNGEEAESFTNNEYRKRIRKMAYRGIALLRNDVWCAATAAEAIRGGWREFPEGDPTGTSNDDSANQKRLRMDSNAIAVGSR